MSIAENVGAMSWFFSRSVTSEFYTKARTTFKNLHKQGYIPDFVYQAVDRAEEATQVWFSAASLLFEAFGFRYIGPVDGHSIPQLMKALENAKEQDVPVLIHAKTMKGKGYTPAEGDPVKWHGVVPFNRDAGQFVANSNATPLPPAYTNVFAETLIELRKNNPKIIGITAAMPTGTGLDKFQKEFPTSFFDVGICEQHAVTFAAGLACEGLTPVCAIYSTFLQRAFDQVLHDVCIQNLPVVFAMDRAGVVGNDGETHQGVFDIAYLRSIPNMVIMAAKDENELRHMLYTATIHKGPIALRYPRGNGLGVAIDKEFKNIEIGKAEIVAKGSEILLIALGTMTSTALKVVENIKNQLGITATVINARFAKPLDHELILNMLKSHNLICTLEDHAIIGGFGSAVSELITDNGIPLSHPILRFGIQDDFIPHGTQKEQHVWNGCDSSSITKVICDTLSNEKTLTYSVGQ
jgi:1-deoxy-D-xylulose-5-phosphate synthase